MKRIVWNYILLMAFAPVLLSAQDRVITKHLLDSVLNPPMVKGETVLLFEKPTIHIGTISEDNSPSTYSFAFTNVSKKAVTVTKVVTSCGCTVAEFSATSVKPNGKGKIMLIFNPYEKAGTVDNKAFVYTSLSAQRPTAKIELVGEVTPTNNQWRDYPCAMGTLRLKRNIVLFNDLTREAVRSERMVCVNSGKNDLRLSALFIPAYAKFRTEPAVIPAGGEADIVITIDGRLLPATLQEAFQFSMVIEGLQAKPSGRTIQVKATLTK